MQSTDFDQNNNNVYREIHDIERRLILLKSSYQDIARLYIYAKQGYSLALINYAYCLLSGIHLKKNDELAIEYLFRAMNKAKGYEQYLLGINLFYYAYIPRYKKIAISYLKRSLELGYVYDIDSLSILLAAS